MATDWGYEAHISNDFIQSANRLLLIQRLGAGKLRYLRTTSEWVEIDPGVSVDDGGLVLPHDSVDAVVDAIKRFKGTSLDSSTEASVLREWLETERARVERVLFPDV